MQGRAEEVSLLNVDQCIPADLLATQYEYIILDYGSVGVQPFPFNNKGINIEIL